MSINALATLSPEAGLARYLAEIRKFPMLSKDEEFVLAGLWRDHADTEAAHRLVTSHLRLVAKIAMGYRGYGLPLSEVISEGNVGLMQAVKKFEPERGFRLATYAMWWIKAAIQEYILKSWSLVKIGTTASQKKLFFNLRKIKREISAFEDGDLNSEQLDHIAEKLNVSQKEVINMNRRLAGPDASLNTPISGTEGDMEWQDWLTDETQDNQETKLVNSEEYGMRHQWMTEAMAVLNDREAFILKERRLKETAATLEDLAAHYNISRERVRQIEVRAFEKLQKAILIKADAKTI